MALLQLKRACHTLQLCSWRPDRAPEFANSIIVVAMPSQFLVYLADGRVPNMPIAKRLHPYQEPHWLPVTLRPAERMATN